MFYVYILQSDKDKRTYVGFCEDVAKRLKQHNAGKVNATKNRRPFRVIYSEEEVNLAKAKKREKYWKSGAGRRRLADLFNERVPAHPCRMSEARPE